MDEIRARVAQITTITITDADLNRVGVTPAQLQRLADAEFDLDVQEYERQRQQLQDEVNAYADQLTVERARGIVELADELARHSRTCHQSVEQCATCTSMESDHSMFWEMEVPAARLKLHRQATGATTEAGGDR